MPLSPQMLKLLPGIESYPKDVQEEVLKLCMKMISLGYMATFRKAELGPVVRTYFFEPFPDAVLSKILSKEEDLALSLGVEAVLITRELGNIAVAVPRHDRETIKFDALLHEMLTTPVTREMYLPLLMGKNPRGESLYLDLATQPHMLIAGATGAGKSIFTSQVILSLALLRPPEDLKFILVDTKQLDLVLFKDLPHVTNVVTQIEELRVTLEMLLEEVRSRTAKLSGYVRNIQEWNKGNFGAPLEYKVLVIDEFADVVDADRALLSQITPRYRPEAVDQLVKKLAQISRAVGVHLIVATQRPSVKVLGGDIKTNFPTRMAFKLPTMQDSRVILDENGAEALLGKGDYLYRTAGSDTTKRAHSAYVSMTDISVMIAQYDMLRETFKQIAS